MSFNIMKFLLREDQLDNIVMEEYLSFLAVVFRPRAVILQGPVTTAREKGVVI